MLDTWLGSVLVAGAFYLAVSNVVLRLRVRRQARWMAEDVGRRQFLVKQIRATEARVADVVRQNHEIETDRRRLEAKVEQLTRPKDPPAV